MHNEVNLRVNSDRRSGPQQKIFRTKLPKMGDRASFTQVGDQNVSGRESLSVGLFRRSRWCATLRP